MKLAWRSRFVAALSLAAAGLVNAEQYGFVGARATGMAGANAASTRDATAQWHNPAAFGFMGREQWASNAVDNGNLANQNFSMEVFGVGGGLTATENMGRYLDILADIQFDAFEKGTLSANGESVKSLLAVAGIVETIDSGDALYADVSAGLSAQIGRLGIGLRMFGEGAAFALPDRENLSLVTFVDGPDLANEIRTAAINDGFNGAGYAYGVLTPDQRENLRSTLSLASADDDAIKFIDAKLGELAAAGDFTGEEVSGALSAFGELLPGGNSIESNQTAVVGRGFAMVEVPVSYGWALNENLSIGVTAKAMFGSVLGAQLWIFDENNEKVLDDLSDNYESSVSFGLDVGVLYRIPNFQFAFVGHNLNRPSFSGFTDTVNIGGVERAVEIPDVNIDPQLTFGAAFMPSERLTLEADFELLETGTLLDGYTIQRLSFGGEVDVWMLALRLGAYNNIAASWQDWVATAGVGARIFGVRADIGGAYSLGNSVDYGGSSIPSEARLYASIGLDF